MSKQVLQIGNIRQGFIGGLSNQIDFALINGGYSQIIVNRLYLELMQVKYYTTEPLKGISIGAVARTIETEYEIQLSESYDQYDLIPLTPDDAQNAFVYARNGDSDLFGIEFCLSPHHSYRVKVCADYYETRNKKQGHIETDELWFSGEDCDIYVNSVSPKRQRYGEGLRTGVYKIVLAKPNQLIGFLSRLDRSTLESMEADFLDLLKSSVPTFRKKALWALRYLGRKEYVLRMIRLLKDSHCKEIAAETLGDIGGRQAGEALLGCLSGWIDRDVHCFGYDFQKKVLNAFGKVADINGLAFLQKYSNSLDEHGKRWLGETVLTAIESIHSRHQESVVNKEGSTVIRILFLAANPTDTTRLRLDEESRAIDQALRQAEFRDKFDVRQHWAVRVTDLQSYLLRHKPGIVHFSGHGGQSSEIILEDSVGNSHPVSVRALSKLFSVLKDNIRCVVLNACYSELQAKAIAEHIDCVVGMSKAIGDSAAISFATAFYQALGYGKDVRTAFDLGCVQVDMENLDEQDTPKLLAMKSKPKEVVYVHNDST